MARLALLDQSRSIPALAVQEDSHARVPDSRCLPGGDELPVEVDRGRADQHVRDGRPDPVRPGPVLADGGPRRCSGAQADPGHQLHRVRAGLRRPRRRSALERRPRATLPRARGAGVLRQRRPPALRLAGLPFGRRPTTTSTWTANFAQADRSAPPRRHWPARWPGQAGQTIQRRRCASGAARTSARTGTARRTQAGVQPGAAVEQSPPTALPIPRTLRRKPVLRGPTSDRSTVDAKRDLGYETCHGSAGTAIRDTAGAGSCHLTLDGDGQRWATTGSTSTTDLELAPGAPARRITEVLQAERPRPTSLDPGLARHRRPRRLAATADDLLVALLGPGRARSYLTGGRTTARCSSGRGLPAGRDSDVDNAKIAATGPGRARPRSTTSRSSPCPTRVRFATDAEQKDGRRQPDRRTASSCATGSRSSTPRWTARSPRSGSSGRKFDTKYARAVLPVGARSSTRPPSPTPAPPPATLQLPPSGLRRRDLRPQRHRARRAQGAGQRGGARASPGSMHERHLRPPVGAQPRGDQRAAVLRGPRQPGLGRPHDELGPGVEVRQRPPAVHLPRALDRQGDAVGGLRAEQRAAVGEHPADHRGLPARRRGGPAR